MLPGINFFLNFSVISFIVFLKFAAINSSILDFFYRINVSDNFLNSYSFFWTSSWYLPLFFFILSSFYVLFSFNYYFTTYSLIVIILLVFYYLEISSFFLSNQFCYFLNSSFNSINFFLTNNINKYHPFIFYLSVVFLIVETLSALSTLALDRSYFRIESFVERKKNFSFLIFFFNANALFLGAWWAQQEGSWGGWWNWDASETFGLFILLNTIFFMHIRFSASKVLSAVYFVLVQFLFIAFIYYFVQLNFDLVSHNFGIKFFYFFNNNLFLIESLYLFLYLSIHVIFRFYRNYSNTVLHRMHGIRIKNLRMFKYYILLFLSFFFFKIILVSFSFLINYFFWNLLSLNFLNREYELANFSTLFILIIFFFFCKLPTNLPLVHIFFFFTLTFPFIFFLKFLFSNMFLTTHLFIFNFLFSNSSFGKAINLEWEPHLLHIDFTVNDVFYFFNKNIALNSYFVECVDQEIIGISKFNSWSTNNILNYFHFKEFSYPASNVFFCNTAYTNTEWNFISLNQETFYMSNVLIYSQFVIIFICYLFLKNANFFK